MTRFILRRILQAIPTLFGVSVIAFAIMSLAPGGPTTALGFNPELTARQRAAMAEALGVNDPWHIQYLRWLLGDGAYIVGGEPAWRVDVNSNNPDGMYYIFDTETGELLESGTNVVVTDVEFEGMYEGVPPSEAPDDLAVSQDDLADLTPELQRDAQLKEAFYLPDYHVPAWRITHEDTYYIFHAFSGDLLTQGAVSDLPDTLTGQAPAEAPGNLRYEDDELAGLLADIEVISDDVADEYEDALRDLEDGQTAPEAPYASAGYLPEYNIPAWRIMSDLNTFFIVSAADSELVMERGTSIRVQSVKLPADKMGYAASFAPEGGAVFEVETNQLASRLDEVTEGPAPRIGEITYLPNYGGTIIWGGRMTPIFDNAGNPVGERMGDHFGILRGDFGNSAISQRPALEVVLERLPATVELGLTSLFLGLTVGLVVGVLAAVFHGTWFDQATRLLAVLVSSIPVFWLGLILLLIFGFYLNLLPMGGRFPTNISGEYTLWERISRLILPVFTLSSFSIATFSRYMRASLLDVLEEDYIRTAYSKGIPRRSVWFQHGMRNALIPIATILGPSLTLVISGAVLTETIYSWPGMGRLLVNSVLQSDYNIIMTVVLLLAVATIVGYMLSDILYAIFDPRVRLS